MPVVKHLTKRQKKRMKSRESASVSENKSDKNQKKGSAGKNALAKSNPSANGVLSKAAAVGAVERALTRSQIPSSDRSETTLPLPPEMPAYSGQRNTYNSRYNTIGYNNSQRDEPEPEQDQYYGRQPSNRVLGHLITTEHYKRIQGAYDRGRLWKLKRLQANKRKREKQAAMAAAAVAAAAPKLFRAELAAPLEEAAELHKSGEPGGVAASPEITAAAVQEGRQLDLGPMSFQRYINGCIDWMFSPEKTDQPSMDSGPTVNPIPIGHEMLVKKQSLCNSTDDDNPEQELEDAVLRIAIQMDALQLNAMTPDDLDLAVMSSGLDVSEVPKRPFERSNWMCAAILNILNDPEMPSSLWESDQIRTPGNCLPEPSPNFYPPLSASEIHAQTDHALAQVSERPLTPNFQYPVEEPTYETLTMPTAFEITQMRGHQLQLEPEREHEPEPISQQAQVPIHTPPPSVNSPTGGNRRAANRGRNCLRGGKGRSRHQNWQANRQYETNNDNQGRYSPHLQQAQLEENYNSNMEQPNEMLAAPVESSYAMTPMAIPPDQNYGQYENMPYAPMGRQQLYSGSQTGADPAADFMAPPPAIDQANSHDSFAHAPMMMQPINPNIPTNVSNAQQMQPQQQIFTGLANKYSTWNAANPPGFPPFAGRFGGAVPYRMAGDHPYAPYAGTRHPGNENDFTLSDTTHFPPLPVPLKSRKKKGKI